MNVSKVNIQQLYIHTPKSTEHGWHNNILKFKIKVHESCVIVILCVTMALRTLPL